MNTTKRPHIDWSMPTRVDRWMKRVRSDGDCWVWTGAMVQNGYGQLTIHGKHFLAHRAFYTYFVAEIPTGLDIDHLCRNRACVNPWHLEPVTRAINTQRGDRSKFYVSDKTHCPAGHAYEAANTYIHNGSRSCKACNREKARRYRARKKAEL